MAQETVRTHVVLPKDLLAEVDKLVGPRQRSQYVAEALAARVRRDLLVQAFDDFTESLSGAGKASDEVTPEQAAEREHEWEQMLLRERDEARAARREGRPYWGQP
jgi:hypothetical protein